MNATIDRRRLGQGLDWPCEGDPFPGEPMFMTAWCFSVDPDHPVADAYQFTLPERQQYRFACLWQLARQMRERKLPARAFRAVCLASVLRSVREVGTEEELAELVETLNTPAEVLARWAVGFGDTPTEVVLSQTLMRSPDINDRAVAEIMWMRRRECREAS